MISVKEEWNILQEYLYLLQTRFQDNITFETKIKDADWEKKIPAFSLQMLMENAIKHNVISRSKPLHIEMWSDKETFIFQNTYQPKQSILHSTGIGLKNINSRFELLTQRAIRIEQTAAHFRVYLPLILPKE
jgi:LytS/YehU family sensor histidine kinase